MVQLRVEYAKSARSKCSFKQCSSPIDKGQVRIGTAKMMPGADTPSYSWRHIGCFTSRQLKNTPSVDSIEGFDDLKPEDQAIVLKMVKGEFVGKGKDALGVSAPPPPPPAKKKGKKEPEKRERSPTPSDSDSDGTVDYDPRPPCKYWEQCFRLGNKEHCAQFKHPGDEGSKSPKKSPKKVATPTPAPVTTSITKPTTGGTGKKLCPHGEMCFRTDKAHFAQYDH
eukprot:PhF_6_TR23781/c0_g1_i2/m.33270